MLVLLQSGGVHRLEGRNLAPLDWTADLIAAAPAGGLVLVRKVPPVVVGYPGLPASAQLIVRGGAGQASGQASGKPPGNAGAKSAQGKGKSKRAGAAPGGDAERVVATLAGDPTELALDGEGRRALVAATREPALGRTAPEAEVALTAVDLASGKATPLAAWTALSQAVPAPGGWLVSASRRAAPRASTCWRARAPRSC